MPKQISIGRLSTAAGVKVPTIRYYEQIGLLPPAVRSENNRRVFDERDVQRLQFIRHARDLGFGVESIRALLALQAQPGQSCETVDAIARTHLADVERRIGRLEALRDELKRMIGQCQQGRIRDCRVLEVLADHGKCMHDHA